MSSAFLYVPREAEPAMADIQTTTVNEEKFHALSRAGDFELSIDATGAEGPVASMLNSKSPARLNAWNFSSLTVVVWMSAKIGRAHV